VTTLARTTSWRSRTGYWWFALTAVAIAAFAPLPYLTTSLQTLAQEESSFALNYVDEAVVVRLALYLHIVFAGVALLLSPLQFSQRVRRRVPALHRSVGRVVLASIGIAGIAGLVMSPYNMAGPLGTAGFGLLALLWLIFAGAAFVTIRRRDVAAHRRWVVRTFALTYAGVMLRLWVGVFVAGQAGFGVDEELAFERAYYVVTFLSWVPNLLVAELYLARGGRSRSGVNGQ
jgi:uncharacterized membrane protein